MAQKKLLTKVRPRSFMVPVGLSVARSRITSAPASGEVIIEAAMYLPSGESFTSTNWSWRRNASMDASAPAAPATAHSSAAMIVARMSSPTS